MHQTLHPKPPPDSNGQKVSYCGVEHLTSSSAALVLRFLIDQREEIFSSECGGLKWLRDPHRISSGTLPSLIVSLLDPFCLDRHLVDIIFLTYEYFTTATILFQQLAVYYDPTSTQKWRIQMRMRVLGLIRIWIDESKFLLRLDADFVAVMTEQIQDWIKRINVVGEERLMTSFLNQFHHAKIPNLFPELDRYYPQRIVDPKDPFF